MRAKRWIVAATVAAVSCGAATYAAAADEPVPTRSGSTTIGSGPDRLVLKMSQDAYHGPALYTVSVDGRQVGGVIAARASHERHHSDTVRVLGTWGTARHEVSVHFLNDAWDGTPSTDRNLYVDRASYDGTRIAGAARALWSDAVPATFAFGSGSTPTPTPTPTGSPSPTSTPSPSDPPSSSPTSSSPTSSSPTSSSPTATAGPGTVSCTSTVTPADDLAAAVAGLGAGSTVCLAPGTYTLADRLKFTPAQSGTADAPAVLAARDGLGTVTIDGNGAEEDLYFTGARHVVVQGLRLTGGAYHGIKIDAPTSDVLVTNDAIFDNFRAGDSQQYSGIKGCCGSSHITIEKSDVYYTHPGPGNNHQGIDCNGCTSWTVRGNHVHGIRSQEYAMGIQFKSASKDITIEDNVVNDNFVGIDYGGFGNPGAYGAGNGTHEAIGGVVRNNLVYGNDDAGISALDVQDGKVVHNTLFGNGFAPDVRRGAVGLEYSGNILDRPLLLRDGTSATQSNDYVLAAPTDGSVFTDAGAGDFTVRPGSPAAGHGADLSKVPHVR